MSPAHDPTRRPPVIREETATGTRPPGWRPTPPRYLTAGEIPTPWDHDRRLLRRFATIAAAGGAATALVLATCWVVARFVGLLVTNLDRRPTVDLIAGAVLIVGGIAMLVHLAITKDR